MAATSCLELQPEKLSIRDQWARAHATQAIKEAYNFYSSLSKKYNDHIADDEDLPQPPPLTDQPDVKWPPEKPMIVNVGIVGAGIAGLFAAKVLEYLNFRLFLSYLETVDPNGVKPTMEEFHRDYVVTEKIFGMKVLYFTHQIHEAADETRVGGRLFTYEFKPSSGPHEYYDVGAMRFPDNPVMKRTFDLFATLGMEKTELKPDSKPGSLIPYYINNSAGEPWCYNDITHWGTYATIQAASPYDSDPFKINQGGQIPTELLQCSPDEIMNSAIGPIRKALRDDLKTSPPGTRGWELLMEYDQYSTRQYLAGKVEFPDYHPKIPLPPYSYETIEWMETMNGGTNWYDQAHSETVLESLDFEYWDPSDSDDVIETGGEKKTDWYCVLGGAQQLAKRLEKNLLDKTRPVAYHHRVKAIKAQGKRNVQITADTPVGEKTFQYNALINTTTLGCMRYMDTSQAGLNYATKQAMRSLGYGASSKVAIKFKHAWWIHDLGPNSIKQGGLGHSDLNLRTCVYPSYNIHDDAEKPAVLLCSYTWQQDGQRIGALTSTNSNHGHKVADETLLKDVLLRELAHLHRNDFISEEKLLAIIRESYMDHHAHDWGEDPNTAGAFAFFRPQQFTHLWSHMIVPAGDIILAGEAASPHHAWVVGALESVVHGLYSWLFENQHDKGFEAFSMAAKILKNDEKGNPFVGLPPYMTKLMAKWHGALGYMHRQWKKDMPGKPNPYIFSAESTVSKSMAGLSVNDVADPLAGLDLSIKREAYVDSDDED
ncbi:amine oxidase [Podospora australis]|uniref:Amine oxidase n=1 Tax=Podospora australis TaxID=1536484 RepID=A0AAN6WUU3_9PEZI|nr:amine oxidase [Podospora australis]